MDEQHPATADVSIPASSAFWGGWFGLSSLATVGLVMAVHPLAFLLAVIFGFHSVFALRQLTRSDGGLRLTEEGLVDHSHWWYSGPISWDEIIDVRKTRWGMIEIELRDENAFWERLSGFQKLARIKTQLYGFSPALIVPWVLDGSRADIVDELQAGLDQFTVRSGAQSPALPRGEPATD